VTDKHADRHRGHDHDKPVRVSGSAGRAGAEPGTTDQPPVEPVLFPDIDPVLLAKVHGSETVQSLPDMEAAALAQGQATAAAGAELEASQHEPPLGSEPPAAP